MTSRWPRSVRTLAAAAIVVGVSALCTLPAGAATATCATVSIATLNATLGIDAAHVTSVHPPKEPTALICSYFGNSGRAANEATINYIPTTAASFAALKASNVRLHLARTIPGIRTSAYSYAIGTERYLYVLDGKKQVQMFAATTLAKLEALGRALPTLS